MTNKTILERIDRYTQTAAEGGACRACEGGAAPAALPAAAGHERVAAGESCLLDIKDSISSQLSSDRLTFQVERDKENGKKSKQKIRKSDSECTYPVRAKYYPMPDGTMRLACVQAFDNARFKEDGWEALDKGKKPKENKRSADDEELERKPEDIQRAVRRARIRAFDLIMCNHDLDLFLTITYAPEAVEDKADYDECYEKLGVWLSNRVQRKGLKYVAVPELTFAGDIHFHIICNSCALDLIEAINPHTGRKLKRNGKQLYNVPEWKHGFTSAEKITATDRTQLGELHDAGVARIKVSKYIFKYMGKNFGARIGGRYVLAGGELEKPYFAYGETIEQFLTKEEIEHATIEKKAEIEGEFRYREYGFI